MLLHRKWENLSNSFIWRLLVTIFKYHSNHKFTIDLFSHMLWFQQFIFVIVGNMIKDNKRTKGQEVNYKDDNNPAIGLQLCSWRKKYFLTLSLWCGDDYHCLSGSLTILVMTMISMGIVMIVSQVLCLRCLR